MGARYTGAHMAWEQSTSASFAARHATADAADAQRVLQSLEHVRIQLEEVVERTPPEMTVVLHSGMIALALSNPAIAATWAATAPSGRRYVTGWSGRREMHILSPAALRERAAEVSGSQEMLRLSGAALYARRTFAENTPELTQGHTPARSLAHARGELRWAWWLEGAGRWFAGQTAHGRAAISRRLREGGRPSFPPGLRDAALLGGTVFDLLAEQRGESAALTLATVLDAKGPGAAIERAFGARLVSIEGEWRSHLARLASAGR
jgi:hypothetical protein